MKKIVYIFLVVLIAFACTKRNCVKTSDISFGELNEGDRSYYTFAGDSMSISICQYITPNGDNINDTFAIASNIKIGDFYSSSFRVSDNCDEVIHLENNVFPFSFPNPNSLEDGQYDFTMSVVVKEGKELISGSGIIRILRK